MTAHGGPRRTSTTPARHPNTSEPLSQIVLDVDLPQLVARYTTEGRQSGPNRVTFSCPNPEHPDRHPSFQVFRSNGGKWRFRCYSQCGAHGDAIDFLQWLEGLSTAEAVERVKHITGRGESRTPPPPRERPQTPLNRDKSTDLVRQYIEWRSWPRWVVSRFGLESVQSSRGDRRVRHPFYRPEQNGELSIPFYQDRASRGVEPKWAGMSGASIIPHNLPSLTQEGLWGLVLTEGPADSISASVALENTSGIAVLGIPGANSWRAAWSHILEGLTVAVWPDSDTAGEHFLKTVRATTSVDIHPITADSSDLSEHLKRHGAADVRHRILDALGGEHSPADTPNLESLLRGIFPGSHVIEQGVRR